MKLNLSLQKIIMLIVQYISTVFGTDHINEFISYWFDKVMLMLWFIRTNAVLYIEWTRLVQFEVANREMGGAWSQRVCIADEPVRRRRRCTLHTIAPRGLSIGPETSRCHSVAIPTSVASFRRRLPFPQLTERSVWSTRPLTAFASGWRSKRKSRKFVLSSNSTEIASKLFLSQGPFHLQGLF